MEIYEVLEARRASRGVSYAELARRSAMNPDVVSRALHGKGELKAGQFLSLCRVLGLESGDFAHCETAPTGRARN